MPKDPAVLGGVPTGSVRLLQSVDPAVGHELGCSPQSLHNWARQTNVAGDNPTRLRNDAALAALCGASPIEASSGKTIPHRLNRGGDRRQGNSALLLIANNRNRSARRSTR